MEVGQRGDDGRPRRARRVAAALEVVSACPIQSLIYVVKDRAGAA